MLIVLSFIAFWVNNTVIYPDIMESRNIVTAREMVREGNYLIPTMNGELRLEKPPLPTWIAAGVERFAPDSLALQRGAAGLAGVMLVVFFYLVGRRATRSDGYAFTASLILLTSYNVVFMGRTASWDIYCHAFMMGAIYYLMRGLAPGRRRPWVSLLMAGAMLGLSFLGKGPVSFYALLLPLVLMCVVMRVPVVVKGRWGGLTLCAAVAVVLSSWWYVYIYAFHAEQAAYVVGKESGAWINHNVRPWWYYWKFFLETGVWSLLMLTTLFVPYWLKRVRFPRKYLFFLGWAMLSLVLLSLMPEKKSRYLLPLLIPCSYAMGFVWDYWQSGRWRREGLDKAVMRINTGLIALVAIALPVLLYIYVYVPGHMSAGVFVLCAVLLLAIAVAMVRDVVRARAKSFLRCVVVLFVCIEVLIMPYVGAIANNTERTSLAATRHIEELRGMPFYHDASEPLRIEMVYAAYRNIRPLDITNADSIAARVPFVLLTHKPAAEVLPQSGAFEMREIGFYDENPRPRGNRRYSDAFAYHATIITSPKDER